MLLLLANLNNGFAAVVNICEVQSKVSSAITVYHVGYIYIILALIQNA